jgi:hypothetical protein
VLFVPRVARTGFESVRDVAVITAADLLPAP